MPPPSELPAPLLFLRPLVFKNADAVAVSLAGDRFARKPVKGLDGGFNIKVADNRAGPVKAELFCHVHKRADMMHFDNSVHAAFGNINRERFFYVS